jgi:hypothetical protein
MVHFWFLDSNRNTIPLDKVRRACDHVDAQILKTPDSCTITFYACVEWMACSPKDYASQKTILDESFQRGLSYLEEEIDFAGYGSCG